MFFFRRGGGSYKKKVHTRIKDVWPMALLHHKPAPHRDNSADR